MESEVVDLEIGWKKIEDEALSKLHRMLREGVERTAPFNKTQYVAVYTTAYQMATQRAPFNYSEQLYTRHNETIRDYLRSVALPELNRRHGFYLLKEVVRRWQDHKIMNKWLHKFFLYLNRYYVDHFTLPTLLEQGTIAFKHEVYSEVKVRVAEAFQHEVERERSGELVDRGVLRTVSEMFEEMGQGSLEEYQRDLEGPLLRSSRVAFASRAESWSGEMSTSDYLRAVETLLVEEAARVGAYLHPETEGPLLHEAEAEFLVARAGEMLNRPESGARAMLQAERSDDLARAFRLLSRTDKGLEHISKHVRDHIKEQGMGIVRAREGSKAAEAGGGGGGGGGGAGGGGSGGAAGGGGVGAGEEKKRKKKEALGDPEFVSQLLELHKKSLSLVTSEFGGHPAFQRGLRDAFEAFINQEVDGCKFSTTDHLAAYCDRVLRGATGERMTDAEAEQALSDILQLFAYVGAKDKFGMQYRLALAKRLLSGRSTSNELERLVLARLKLACGAGFTSKMEGMLSDMQLAGETAVDFQKYLADTPAEAARIPFEFDVTVLTSGFWPSFRAVPLKPPHAVQVAHGVFEKYFHEKSESRRLAWTYAQGSATLRASLASGPYEFLLAPLQASVLLLYNSLGRGEGEEVPLTTIRDALGVDDDIVKRTLHSLSCGKVRILKKSTSTRTIALTDAFALLTAFSSPHRRVRIQMASLEESGKDAGRVEDDRRQAIDACVVRIMKARKTLRYQDLMGLVLKQLSTFRPNPKTVKVRIESLIDADYIERDEKDPSVFSYVA